MYVIFSGWSVIAQCKLQALRCRSKMLGEILIKGTLPLVGDAPQQFRAHAEGVVPSDKRVSAFYDLLKPPF